MRAYARRSWPEYFPTGLVGLGLLVVWVFLLLAGSAGEGQAALPGPPDWVYHDLAILQEAGLLPEYPAEMIAAGYLLSRYECAYYLRLVLLRVKDGDPRLTAATVGEALFRLAEELRPELEILGIEVVSAGKEEPVYCDLDVFLTELEGYPTEAPPGGPPDLQETEPMNLSPPRLLLTMPTDTYRQTPTESLRLFFSDSAPYPQDLLGLVGEVLGLEWATDFSSLSSSLRWGGFTLKEEEQERLRGGFGLRLDEEFQLGFDALWLLDLDEAKLAMDRLKLNLNLNTLVPLIKGNLDLFGGLSLEYQGQSDERRDLDYQALAGLRVPLGDEVYLIAEYTMANSWRSLVSRPQGPAVGLSLGDIGLILLGFRASTETWEDLEISGLFLYRF